MDAARTPIRSGLVVARLAPLAVAVALAACGSPGAFPSTAPGGSPGSPGGAPAGATAPSGPAGPSPSADQVGRWARIEWRPVETAILKPHGGFEHRFLASARGMLIMITNLEGDPTTLIGTSADGETWQLRSVQSSTVPLGREINGGADWLQVVEVPIGRQGQALVASADGLAWDTRSQLPDALPPVQEAVADGDSILACGSRPDGRPLCALSGDAGRTWDLANDITGLVEPFAAIRGLVRLGTGWVAIVEGSREGEANVLTSPDGLAWTGQPDPIAAGPAGPCVVGATVVVVGTHPDDPARALMSASLDGVTWRAVPVPRTANVPRTLVGIGGAIVAIGERSEPEGSAFVGDIIVSADGWTWRLDAVPGPMRTWPDPMFYRVADRLLAIGPDAMLIGRVVPAADPGPPAASAVTPPPVPSGSAPPAVDWTAGPSLDEGEPSDVTAWAGGYVAVGWGSLPLSNLGAMAWISGDGLTWTPTLWPERNPDTRMISVASRGSMLVAAGWEWQGETPARQESMRAAFWRSHDGRTWERVPDQPDFAVYRGMLAEGSVDPRLNDLVAGGPGFVAVGATSPGGATVWTSTDGWDWRRTATLGQGSLDAVILGGPGLVAVGTDGVWTSVDGLSWSKAAEAPDAGLWDVTGTGSLLVAAGSRGTVWWSTDGLTWEQAPDQPALREGDMAVVVGMPWGVVGLGSTTCAHSARACPAYWTSADGRRWERTELPPGETAPVFNPVAAAAVNDLVVAVGARHELVLRQDQGMRSWVGRLAP